MRRKLGDRRTRPRFDIVGELWGTLKTVLYLPLRNIGHGGLLVESDVSLPIESAHRLLFDVNGQQTSAEVRVRHVHVEQDHPVRRYLIGMEFVSASPALVEHIQSLLSEGADGVAVAEG